MGGTGLEKWDRRENAEVEDILHEVKRSKGERDKKVDDAQLDDILAGLGVGARKPQRGAAPKKEAPPAGQTGAKAGDTTVFTAPAPRPKPQPAHGRTAVFSAVPAEETAPGAAQRPSAPPAGPAAGNPFAGVAPKGAAPKAPPKKNLFDADEDPRLRRKKQEMRTSIWDVEVEHGPVQPRVGKAAALDKVDRDKFATDTELLSWFSEDDSNLTRKERRRRAKEEKVRLKQLQKEEKARQKYGGDDAFAEEEYAEDVPFAADSAAGGWGGDEDLFADRHEDELDELAAEPEYGGRGVADPAPRLREAAVAQVMEDDSLFTPPEDVLPAEVVVAAAMPVEEPAPLWDAVDADEVVTGSAFDEGPCDDNWPEEGSLFGAAPDVVPEEVAPEPVPRAGAGWRGAPLQEVEAQQVVAPTAQNTAAPPEFDEYPEEDEASEPVKPSTKSFEIVEDGEGDYNRVPTAAFTQEFELADSDPSLYLPPEDITKSLFVDEMVDDRFREFFSETVIVQPEDLAETARMRRKNRKKRKKHASFVTGEFAQLAHNQDAEDEYEGGEEEPFEDEGALDEYTKPQDAENIIADLAVLKKTLLVRSGVTAGIALVLLWFALALAGTLPLPGFMAPAQNGPVFAVVYLALIVAAIAVNFTTVASGLAGLFSEPTTDSAPALASVAVLLQGVVVLVQYITKAPVAATLFGCVAALILTFNALGKFVRARSILANFQLTSAGFDHSAAYVLDAGHDVSYSVTRGLEEEDPTLLISRPTALVKGFMRQSFSPRGSDRLGRILGWVLLLVSLVVGVIAFVMQRDLLAAVSSLAAVLCIGAPLSSSLVSGIPAALLQQSTAKVGAVVPGWSAIEELGEVNTVIVGAKDIFPAGSVQLHGIKTFRRERIDLAILYAASVLVAGSDTMKDIFLAVIQNKSDMLYKVESLTYEPGRGFTAWVNNNRVVVGTREMLQKHDIAPPNIEVEMKYASQGRLPVYLAVAGKLFAMFIVSYEPDEEVQATLDGLVKSGISLLVDSNDMNVTGELIEEVYQLPGGVVKVLGSRELEMLEPLTEYRDESDGVMTHIGSFTSFIGGMRAAAGCAASERMAGILQMAAVVLASLLSLLLVFSGTLAGLSLVPLLIYQAAWTLMVSAVPLARRY